MARTVLRLDVAMEHERLAASDGRMQVCQAASRIPQNAQPLLPGEDRCGALKSELSQALPAGVGVKQPICEVATAA